METSLQDLTRGLTPVGAGCVAAYNDGSIDGALDRSLGFVDGPRDASDDGCDGGYEIEYVYDAAVTASAEDALADAWFAEGEAQDATFAAAPEPEMITTSHRGVHVILAFGLAVMLAACLHVSAI